MSEFLYFGDDLSIYREIPVDIDTFIEDPYFIGKYTDNGKRIYPFWRNALRKVFSSENTTRNVIVSTAIGTGKTRFCHIATAYSLYLFMCLNNPQQFFKMVDNNKFVFAMGGVGEALAKQQVQMFCYTIKDSGWFNSHGTFSFDEKASEAFSYEPLGNSIEVRACYKEDQLYGENVVSYNLSWIADKYNKRDTSDLYRSLDARVRSRTVRNSIQYGFGFVDIENNCGDVFMQQFWTEYPEDYMTFSGSQWDIRPQYTFSNERFAIITDRIKGHSKAVDLIPEELREIPDGYDIILAPKEFMQMAKLDPDTVLQEIAGIRLKDETGNDI